MSFLFDDAKQRVALAVARDLLLTFTIPIREHQHMGSNSNSPTITDLEHQFGIVLPDNYKRVLSDFPESLRKPIFAGQPNMGRPCDIWFLNDLSEIAQLNKSEREFWPEAEWTRGRSFPRHLFLIGSDDGNLFALNLRRIRVFQVVIWRHELPLGIWLPLSLTLNGFVRKCSRWCE
ncbi:MAG: SMI1/KNR4 family protein [Aeoliella sp.]